MQVPPNTTNPSSIIVQAENQEWIPTLLSHMNAKFQQITNNSVAVPLQQALTTNASPSVRDHAVSTIATSARDALTAAADTLRHLLYPQPTTILTTPRQENAAPKPEDTTIVAPPANDAAPPPKQETVVETPPQSPPPTSEGKTTPGSQGGGSGNTPITTPSVEPSPSTNSPSFIPSHSKEFERTGEIEWRPRLNNGNLTMYFRPEHNRLADKVEIFSADGKTLLATGKKSGLTQDNRPIYNFDKPGSSFPDGAIVLMTVKNGGGARTLKIPDTSERYVHGASSAAPSGGSTTAPSPQSLIPTSAKDFEKTGQIEWRPRLNDGNLSIIFRRSHKDMAEKVQIFSADGKTPLATGKWQRNLDDGRPIYAFDKPGDAFEDGAVVLVTLKGGGARRLSIPDTSERFTY